MAEELVTEESKDAMWAVHVMQHGFTRESFAEYIKSYGIQYGQDAFDNAWTTVRLLELDKPFVIQRRLALMHGDDPGAPPDWSITAMTDSVDEAGPDTHGVEIVFAHDVKCAACSANLKALYEWNHPRPPTWDELRAIEDPEARIAAAREAVTKCNTAIDGYNEIINEITFKRGDDDVRLPE